MGTKIKKKKNQYYTNEYKIPSALIQAKMVNYYINEDERDFRVGRETTIFLTFPNTL